MRFYRYWPEALILLFILGPVCSADDQAIPDRKLLEFIADFEDTDDETFELMLFFGQRDADSTEFSKQLSTEEFDNENP